MGHGLKQKQRATSVGQSNMTEQQFLGSCWLVPSPKAMLGEVTQQTVLAMISGS